MKKIINILLSLFITSVGFTSNPSSPQINKLTSISTTYNSDQNQFKFHSEPDILTNKVNEGRKYISEARYVDAVEAFNELLQLSKAVNDSVYMSTAYTYLCLTNGLVGNSIESLEYAEMANSYIGSNSDKRLSQWAKVGLGSAYYLNKNYSLADSLLSESIAGNDALNYDNQYLIYAYQYLGALRIQQGKVESAKELLETAIGFPNTHHTNSLISCYYQLGQVYSRMNENATAHKYFQRAHDLAVKEPDKSILARIYMHKARFYKKIGNYERSTYFYALTDSLYENVLNAKVSQEVQKVTMNLQRQSEIKEVEIKKQHLEIERLKVKRQAARLTALLSILLFSFSIALTIFMFKRKLRAQKMAQLEQEISKQKELQLNNFIKGQEEERNRLARDLHDGIGSQMALLKMNLSKISQPQGNSIEGIQLPIRLCDDIYQSLRDVAFNLLPRPLVRDGLIAAIKELSSKLTKSSGIEFSVNNFGFCQRLSQFQEAGIFRITQEITANIVKHSSATMARIDITCDAESIGVSISWNGKGFNPETLESSTGYGWKNINTRLNQLGGNIFIDSSENSQSSIAIVDIPIKDLKLYGKTG